MIYESSASCAARCLSDMYEEPKKLIAEVKRQAYTFYFIVDNNHINAEGDKPNEDEHNGAKFIQFLLDNKLGKVVSTDWERNEFYGHAHDPKDRRVCAWIWTPDWKAVKNFKGD